MTGYMSKRSQTETSSTKVIMDEWKMSKTSNVNLTTETYFNQQCESEK